MNEKRFKLAYEKGNEAIFEDLDHPYPIRITNKEVERKLNELSTSCRQLEREVKSLNAFLVHKGLAEEYIRWKGDLNE